MCLWLRPSPESSPAGLVTPAKRLFLDACVLPGLCHHIWTTFTQTCWVLEHQLARFPVVHSSLDMHWLHPSAARFCAAGLGGGGGGGGGRLPGLPQSAHVSLPGLASTSCRSRLFPSGSSAMVSLSIQPHREEGKKPDQEHPLLESDRQTERQTDCRITCHLRSEAEKRDWREERLEETERSEPMLEETSLSLSLSLSLSHSLSLTDSSITESH